MATIRGQTPQSWIARWRKGTCPMHGIGCNAPVDGMLPEDAGYTVAGCGGEECSVVIALWPGKDRYHSKQGWVGGPDEIRTVLVKAGELSADGPEPGRYAISVRTSWPTEQD